MLSPKKIWFILFTVISFHLNSQKNKTFTITSPGGNIQVKIDAGATLQWSATHQSQTIIAPSAISLTLQTGEVLGENVTIVSSKKQSVNQTIHAVA
ncbi:MAG: glycoside hydrolase family 97 N-terminal domain-containing protein, partial [Chitinophagales bacterium]